MASVGVDGLASDLEFQRAFVRAVPSYHCLLELLHSSLDGALVARLEPLWRGRVFLARYERPLLLLGALRFAALRAGPGGSLYASLVEPGTPETLSRAALLRALDDEVVWHAIATRRVQTNEVSRAVCWLWIAQLVNSRHPEATFDLYDVGASAGLNLLGDELPMPWTDADGQPLFQRQATPTIRARVGFEKNPIDPLDAEDARWLRACLWPGQHERLRNLELALGAARALADRGDTIRIEPATVREVPARLLPPSDHAIAYQTLVRDYVDADEFARYRAGMLAWLSAHPRRAFWVELELRHDDSPPETSCSIAVHVAPGGARPPVGFELGRCHPHPSLLHVREDAVGAFLEVLMD